MDEARTPSVIEDGGVEGGGTDAPTRPPIESAKTTNNINGPGDGEKNEPSKSYGEQNKLDERTKKITNRECDANCEEEQHRRTRLDGDDPTIRKLATATFQETLPTAESPFATPNVDKRTSRFRTAEERPWLGRIEFEEFSSNRVQISENDQPPTTSDVQQPIDKREASGTGRRTAVAPIKRGYSGSRGCAPDAFDRTTSFSDWAQDGGSSSPADRICFYNPRPNANDINPTDGENEGRDREIHNPPAAIHFISNPNSHEISQSCGGGREAVRFPSSGPNTKRGETSTGDTENGGTNQNGPGSQIDPEGVHVTAFDGWIYKRADPTAFTAHERRSASNIPWNWPFKFFPASHADGDDTEQRGECYESNQTTDNIQNSGRAQTSKPGLWRVFNRMMKANVVPKNNKPRTPDNWNLPLHVKLPSEINLERAKEILLDERKQYWNIGYDAIYNEANLENIFNSTEAAGPWEAELSDSDLGWLIKFGYSEEHQLQRHGPIRGWVRVRTEMEKLAASISDEQLTPERQKLAFSRRRMLSVPEVLNAYYADLGYTPLTDVTQQIEDARIYGPGAFVSDAPSYYRQYILPINVRRFFAFIFKGKSYVLRTIPTGHCMAPTMTDAVMYSCVRRAIGENPKLRGCSHIDNVRILGPQHEVEIAKHELETITNSIGLELDFSPQWSTAYEFLGVSYETTGSELKTSIATKSWLKLNRFAAEDLYHAHLSMRQAMRWCGSLIWSCRIRRESLHKLYWIIKFFRRRVSKAQKTLDEEFLDSPASIWESIKTLWGETHSRCIGNAPGIWSKISLCDRVPEIYLFSDASLDGWGTVLFADGKILVDCAPWAPGTNHNINVLESMALEHSIRFLQKYLTENKCQPPPNVFIFVDNTSVIGATQKGQSQSFHLNVLAGRILQALHLFEGSLINRWEIRYVVSADNYADTPSRMFGKAVPK